MTLSNTLRRKYFRDVAKYVLDRSPTEAEIRALFKAALLAQAHIDEDILVEDLKRLASATEAGLIIQLLEKITARVARGILSEALEDEHGNLAEAQAKWISGNVQARSAFIYRAQAIWRVVAELGSEHDQTIHDHALKSAHEGITQEPVPRAEPDPLNGTGPEDTMTDPTVLRDKIMSRTAFNPGGLPAALREEGGQKIYLDAVIQAVALLGHEPKEENTILWATATAGMMLLDGHYDARDQRFFAHVQKAVAELSGSAKEEGTIAIDGHVGPGGDPIDMFAPDMASTQRATIFAKTWSLIEGGTGKATPVFLQSFAHTGRKMTDRYHEHKGDLKLMGAMVAATYESHITDDAGGAGGGGVANFDLPPLNDPAGYNDEIERDNIRAVSTIYVSYQLEFGLKSCARLLDLFVAGLLPISAADGNARELDNLYWDQEDLLDEGTRRSIYARVLGAPGGELSFDMQPNSEFNTLLMRVVSAVSEYEREQSVLTHFDNASRGRRFQSTSGEFVRKAVRDFAANASLRGWAGTAFTAERMARQVKRVMRVLNLPAVKNAYGVSTPWQVIERISQREFGITVNTVLHRTLAVETQRIMAIIANNHTIWSNGSGLRELFSDTPDSEGDLSYEDTKSLMIACQHFRAVTGVGDALLDEYSKPVETSAHPSLPDFGGMGGMSGGGAGAMPNLDMGGIDQLRDMVNNGQTPDIDQIRSLLPNL